MKRIWQRTWLGVFLTIIGYFYIALIGGTLILGDKWGVFKNAGLSILTLIIVAFVAFNAAIELKNFFQK